MDVKQINETRETEKKQTQISYQAPPCIVVKKKKKKSPDTNVTFVSDLSHHWTATANVGPGEIVYVCVRVCSAVQAQHLHTLVTSKLRLPH